MENKEVMAMPQVNYSEGVIDFNNYETLVNKAKELATQYSNLIITDEDSYKFAKQVKAELNKVIKAISDERIRIKKEYAKPLENFESKVKEITSEIETGKNLIDERVKEYDQKLKDQKQAKINDLIQRYSEGRYIEQNAKWLNRTFTDTKIVEEIKEQVEAAFQAEERIAIETQLIKDTCETNEIDVDGFLSMYHAGSAISEVLTAINISVSKRKKQAEEDALRAENEYISEKQAETEPTAEIIEQAKPIEVDPFVEIKQQKSSYLIRVSVTSKQLELLDRYLRANEIDFSIGDSNEKHAIGAEVEEQDSTFDDLPW